MEQYYASCRTPLHNFERGNDTLERYCGDIILDQAHLFRGAINSNFLFMEDDACLRKNAEASNSLESDNTNCIQWLAYSYALNPIVHD